MKFKKQLGYNTEYFLSGFLAGIGTSIIAYGRIDFGIAILAIGALLLVSPEHKRKHKEKFVGI